MGKGHLGRSVSIIGVGYTPYGDVRVHPEIKDFSERELYAMACIEAMRDGNIEAKDIDAYYVGMTGPGFYAKTKGAAPMYAEWIGMRHKPTLFHDEGCGTSGFGLQEAVQAVASGIYDCVISGAVNINLSQPLASRPPHIRETLSAETLTEGINAAVDAAYEKPGQGGVGCMEGILLSYRRKYGYSFRNIDEALGTYMIGARRQAKMNPKAVTVTETYEEEAKRQGFNNTLDYVLDNKYNPRMGTLIRAKFLGKTVDGASAIIVCATEKAYKYTKKPIEVVGVASDVSLNKDWVEAPLQADARMFKEAYAMAGITNPEKEVQYMGIHDCTGTPTIINSEAAGYIPEGQAVKYLIEGETTFEGKKPMTTSGGRVHLGHAISPSYAVEVAEAVKQMRGENGNRQMKDEPNCSVIWGGGTGFQDCVTVLRKI